MVRVAPAPLVSGENGYVVTFEDLTDLGAAQRKAAWGDIARRVAHEIKNPLTPIQLAAERLRDRVAPDNPETRDLLNRYADLISRQVTEINRLVDEFSRFARMPVPQYNTENLCTLLDSCVLLERTAHADIEYMLDMPAELQIVCDRGLLSRAVANLLKNSAYAVHARAKAESAEGLSGSYAGQILVRLREVKNMAEIEIEDNGIGFPKAPRNELLEPYRSYRAEGTGLGLAMPDARSSHTGAPSSCWIRFRAGARGCGFRFP